MFAIMVKFEWSNREKEIELEAEADETKVLYDL